MKKFIIYTAEEIVRILEKDASENQDATPTQCPSEYEFRSNGMAISVERAIETNAEIAIRVY